MNDMSIWINQYVIIMPKEQKYKCIESTIYQNIYEPVVKKLNIMGDLYINLWERNRITHGWKLGI